MGQFTGFLLNWVGTSSREAFFAGLGALELHPHDFVAMVVIDAKAGLAQQELGDATHVDPSTMVAIVDRLEQPGWPSAGSTRRTAVNARCT